MKTPILLLVCCTKPLWGVVRPKVVSQILLLVHVGAL